MLMDPKSSGLAARPVFATTHWTVVLEAKDAEAPGAQEAFETICRAYWQPLYSFIRREGYSDADAKDLTQEFFARFIDKKYLEHLRHQAGRFRSFLLTFLKHFLQETRGKARAQKRGGGKTLLSLEEMSDPGIQLWDCVDHLTPDSVFERRWAQAVLQQSFDRLREEYNASGRGEIFAALADFQPREPGAPSYNDIAERLRISESAVKTAAHRLRQRHREILRNEIRKTVSTEAGIDDELRFLHAVLSKGHIG
jgi:RNA polymerase sigma-70 factor (ECF subfamily)